MMHLLKAWAKLAKFIKGIPTSFDTQQWG